MIAGPELSREVSEFEDLLYNISAYSSKHHDQVPHVLRDDNGERHNLSIILIIALSPAHYIP